MQLYLDGERIMEPLDYNWPAQQRLHHASGGAADDWANQDVEDLLDHPVLPPKLRWRFEGSPLTLHRVRVDRDLFYRPDKLSPMPPHQKNQPYISGSAFGTNPTEKFRIGDGPNGEIENGKLGPDQFMMCGDNSQMSLDSRLWGSPHPLVAAQIDASPFVVNRKLLLGKAWVVYFPAPFAITEGGVPVVPDFGRLRFIR
jgi:hypothetical protein